MIKQTVAAKRWLFLAQMDVYVKGWEESNPVPCVFQALVGDWL